MYVIVVLGCSIEWNDLFKKYVPGDVLKNRLFKTVEVYNEMCQKYNDVIIIVSGGIVRNNILSEASVMKEFLSEHNIPKSSIFEENASRNTIENCIYSHNLINNIMKMRINVQDINGSFIVCPYYGTEPSQSRELTYPINLILITSDFHMERSLKLMKHFLPNVNLIGIVASTPEKYLAEHKKKEANINIEYSIKMYFKKNPMQLVYVS